jgi:hypothetical protein
MWVIDDRYYTALPISWQGFAGLFIIRAEKQGLLPGFMEYLPLNRKIQFLAKRRFERYNTGEVKS